MLDPMVTSRRLLLSLTAALLVVTVSACGPGEDSESDVRGRVAAQLRANGLDDDAASCVAEVLVDELGKDAIQDIELDSSEPQGSLDTDLAAAALEARATCKVDITQLTG